MSASDILGSGNRDLDTARMNRDNRLNPPTNAPGQDSTFSDTDDIFSGNISQSPLDSGFSSLGSTPVGGFGGLGSPMGGLGSPMGGLGGLGGMNQNPQAQPKSDEDKFFDAMVSGGKTTMSFFQEVCKAGKDTTKRFWASYGKDMLFTGIACTAIGFVSLLLRQKSLGINLMVSGLLTTATGTVLLMTNIAEARGCSSMYKSDNTDIPAGMGVQPEMSFENMGSGMEFEQESDESYFSDEDEYEDDGSDYGFGDDEDDYAFNDDDFLSAQPVAGMNMDDALNSMIEITNGMITRQYLFEMFTKVLPNLKPDYSTIKEIDEDSDIFVYWDDILRESAQATGVKEDYLDELNLVSLTENLFTIKLRFNKVPGIKIDAVGTELVNIYSHSGDKYNPNVYCKVSTMGLTCEVIIFTGETAMISLKDMLSNCKDFFLDDKNYMPVVLGIDESGHVIMKDFKKLESILITGMPRSGKSWFVQAVLTQMCALVPPSQLNIYICDPKDGISDFKAFCLPHVKKFVSGDANIVNTLRKVVKEEAPRRKKIIGDAGFVNIWDYKQVNPTVKLPIIYVLIDEVVTLAERMDKETKSEFQGLLVELISQLPALGIRAFLIPHVVKNDIIAKTATDLIPCRISVCGDAGHIESSTGTKPKDFGYRLTNKGDMAVKLSDETQTLFVHGPALTSSNPENNNLFDYMRKVWTKIEPEEVQNSVAKSRELEEANEKLLVHSNDEEMDLFNEEATNDESLFTDENKIGLSSFNNDSDLFSMDDF